MNSNRVLALLLAATAVSSTAYALEWSVSTVDASGSGRYSSMRIDRKGNAHVIYSIEDGNSYPLRYSFWDSHVKRWFTMTVAQGAGACSLALDSKDNPHVSWVDAGSSVGSKLHHAYWKDGRWMQEAIPLPSQIVAYYNSIAIGESDYPVISFYEYRGPRDSGFVIRLRTVMWNGQVWELRTADAAEGSGKFNSLTTDSAKRIHLAYANVSAGTSGLRYATWDGRSWQPEVIEPGNVGYSVFVAADRDGNPHISYVDMTRKLIKIAIRKNGQWTIEAVDTVAGFAYPDRNSIAFDEEGRVYLTYFDSSRGTLKLARRSGTGWLAETVDANGAGFTSAVAIHDGIVWISYADEVAGSLKVARASLASQPATISPSAGVTRSQTRTSSQTDALAKR